MLMLDVYIIIKNLVVLYLLSYIFTFSMHKLVGCSLLSWFNTCRYLKSRIPPEERGRFHFFNCFFFRKLANLDKGSPSSFGGREAYQRVQKWTKNVELFEKDYIFIPINFR